MKAKVQKESLKRKNTLKSFFNFFGDVKTEFLKVTWTSKDDLVTYTKIVVALTLALGMAVFFADLMIKTLLEVIAYVLRIVGA